MTRIKLLLGIVLVIGLALLVESLPAIAYRHAVVRGMLHAKHHPDLYHQRPGEPCRTGYYHMPKTFSVGRETWDGCWNLYGPFTIDFLLDNEDVALGAVVHTK